MVASEGNGPLNRYIERVRSIPKLSREDEHALALRARSERPEDAEDQRTAADALVEANLRYVVAVALQYRRYGLRLADLIAEGNVGLMHAVRKFDPDRGTRFVTYAGYWIRAMILDFVVRSTSMVGGGSGALRSKVFFRLRRERAKLSNLDMDSTERNRILAESFGVTPERMRQMTARLDNRDVSLDRKIFSDSGVSMVDTLMSSTASQDELVFESQKQSALNTRLSDCVV